MSLEHQDVSVNAMADHLGLSRKTLSRWMHDDIVPKDGIIKQWALITGVPYAWLRYGVIPTENGGDLLERTSRCKVVEVDFGRVEALAQTA